MRICRLLRRLLIETPDKPILLVLRFAVSGNLRFLSHAETVRVFQRACARAGLDVAYSRGFNPRPKISLPLPRSVALACQDEICLLRLNHAAAALNPQTLKDRLNEKMPCGIDLLDAQLLRRDISFHKGTAVYRLTVGPQQSSRQLTQRASQLLQADTLVMTRQPGAATKTRTVDVRRFLESIEVHNLTVVVRAEFSPKGSIRVDEILSLLRLEPDCLDGPVTRIRVLSESLLDTQRHN